MLGCREVLDWGLTGSVFQHTAQCTLVSATLDAHPLSPSLPQASHERILSHYFHNSRPKFQRVDPEALTPILHGKAMLATSADGTRGVMFVGSQNFSKASWGERKSQPTNVEIGVVVKADTLDGVQELRERFPVQLAPDEQFGISAVDRGYVMARGPTNGDNSMQGLQMRWPMRCNDLGWLKEWRRNLNGWWNLGWPIGINPAV